MTPRAMVRPLVSVVVPTYQRASVLGEALRSVLTQSYDLVEVLVEDDGSTDGSAEVVARLADPRVRYAWSPNVGRPAPVRNRAIAKASGSLVAFLDSDDVWVRGKLEAQLEVLLRDPELLAVSSDATWLPPRKRSVLSLRAEARPSFDELLVNNVVMLSGAVVRREAFDAVGVFDERAAFRGVEDYDLWLRMLRHRDRSIRVLATPHFHYRASPDGIAPKWRTELDALRWVFGRHEDFRPEAVREALASREGAVRRGELRGGLKEGTVSLAEWLRAPEVPLRRRLRLAAKAVILGRARV